MTSSGAPHQTHCLSPSPGLGTREDPSYPSPRSVPDSHPICLNGNLLVGCHHFCILMTHLPGTQEDPSYPSCGPSNYVLHPEFGLMPDTMCSTHHPHNHVVTSDCFAMWPEIQGDQSDPPCHPVKGLDPTDFCRQKDHHHLRRLHVCEAEGHLLFCPKIRQPAETQEDPSYPSCSLS